MEYIVYLSYEDGLPTLWDSPQPGAVKAIWREVDGRITVEQVDEEEE